jgi:hypothetical protein
MKQRTMVLLTDEDVSSMRKGAMMPVVGHDAPLLV